jgi:hypothetical protein
MLSVTDSSPEACGDARSLAGPLPDSEVNLDRFGFKRRQTSPRLRPSTP